MLHIVPCKIAMLYGEFSIKKKEKKILGKSCKRYEASNQASHQLGAEGPH